MFEGWDVEEEQRDFIPPNARDDAEVSLRRPTRFRPDRNLRSQERMRKKKPASAAFGMTVVGRKAKLESRNQKLVS
jgi:hypothetical protein